MTKIDIIDYHFSKHVNCGIKFQSLHTSDVSDRKVDIFWEMSFRFNHTTPSWQGMMHLMHKGCKYPGKSSVQFLPVIDINPGDKTCILHPGLPMQSFIKIQHADCHYLWPTAILEGFWNCERCSRDRGEKLVEFCKRRNLYVANTWFCQDKRRRYTWKSPGDRGRYQIDYIFSDHNLVAAKINTRDYFDATASNWNTSAHSHPLARSFV